MVRNQDIYNLNELQYLIEFLRKLILTVGYCIYQKQNFNKNKTKGINI